MRSKQMIRTVAFTASAALAFGACSDEFDPYNRIDGFRLLAIAADRPSLLPGDTAELSALLTVDDSAASFAWSWCPLTTGPEQGYECAVTRDEMQAAADAALGAGVLDVPALALGSEPSATFAYDSLPPEFLLALCEVLRDGEIPDFLEIPDCESSFPMTIRLEVESAGGRIVGVKEIELLYEEGTEAPNRNPTITEAFAIHPAEPGVEVAIAADGSTTLVREVEYTLRLAIPASEAETYTEDSPTGGPPERRREDLIITWFVEAGDTDVMRTSFLEGEIPLDRASKNLWTTPSAEELGAATTRLYFVIRDNRGGTNWITRSLGLED